MKGVVADEASTRSQEQVGVVLRQVGKGVKGNTIDDHKDQSGEARFMIELNPMSIVVIRHHLLNYSSTPRSSFLYTANSVMEDHYGNIRTIRQEGEEDRRGIHKDDEGRHGAPRSQLQPDTRDSLTSLPLSEQNTLWVRLKDSLNGMTLDLMQGHPHKPD
jgi:hypothetical protein